MKHLILASLSFLVGLVGLSIMPSRAEAYVGRGENINYCEGDYTLVNSDKKEEYHPISNGHPWWFSDNDLFASGTHSKTDGPVEYVVKFHGYGWNHSSMLSSIHADLFIKIHNGENSPVYFTSGELSGLVDRTLAIRPNMTLADGSVLKEVRFRCSPPFKYKLK